MSTPDSFFSSAHVAERVAALRAVMAEEGIDVYLVPRGDMFRGEQVPANAERLAFLTGFTGSAGLAVVGRERAALFVDGRYTLQAPTQTDGAVFEVVTVGRADLPAEIRDFLPDGGMLGYDPMLFSPREVEKLRELTNNHLGLAARDNLIDRIWTEGREVSGPSVIEILGDNRTGRSTEAKLDALRAEMAEKGADAAFLGLPDSVCWLFNIRGHDMPQIPVVLAFALVRREGRPTLFLNTTELGGDVERLSDLVDFADLPAVMAHLVELGDAGKTVWIDPQFSPAAIADKLSEHGGHPLFARDPVIVPKSRKNDVEMAGMRQAQAHDALAMVKFLAWLDKTAPEGQLTEIGIAERLLAFRAENEGFIEVSFDTIAGAGPNGAIVHYHATEETSRTLVPGELLLVDSGGQYESGTTDTTRTMATGPVTEEQKDRFTRVLKGMIGISMARFPKGASGAQLDVLARNALWQAGLDYAHGTGHGVGHYLSVHEGPIGISPRAAEPLAAGNVISNEPGYYKEGAYGIRIENLVHLVESADFEGFLEFETLTYIPIDRRLIDPGLLTDAERDWLNAYHKQTFDRLADQLDDGLRAWLAAATAPL